MISKIFLFFLLCFHTLCLAKPPSLTPKDTKNKIQEILKAHVTYQSLNEEIIARAFLNYLDEVDPLKTYFIEDEIVEFLSPSDTLIQKTLQGILNEDFSSFFSLHEKFLASINRRNLMEEEILSMDPPSNVKASEFKNLTWAQDEGSLKNRLLKIKALQLETAEKLSASDQDQFAQKLTKRRVCRQEELSGKSLEERKQVVLASVLKSVSSALDSQTAYFTPSEANQFMMQVQQKLYGIGAHLRDDLNGLVIIRLLEGGPASVSNKLKVGDKIIAVNKEPILGMDISEAVDLIRGRQGTSVSLTVLRNHETTPSYEEKLEVDIIRDEVILKESRLEASSHPFGDGVIGIFHLFSFYEDSKNSSAKDLAKAICELKEEHNLKGVVLDLRNNAGGLLKQAVAVTSLFISKGIVVSIKDNTGHIEHLRNLEDRKVWDGPLLVLTNRGSASASEIVSQTLQEYGRALVVGDPETFGKGTFQTFTLETANYGKVNAKGEFKVTRGRYYTVSGKSPQLVGVQADIVVPGLLFSQEVGERYTKFPLSTDEISAGFEDNLSDVSPILRNQIQRLYGTNRQVKLSCYAPYLPTLKANSEKRISYNKNYQSFLEEIKSFDEQKESVPSFGQNDLQLTETIHIMTDLIFLTELHQASSHVEEPMQLAQ
jgi:carboxyl-terminal processing protease